MPSAAKSLHPKQPRRDTNRANANARGYNYQWHRASKRFLYLNPLCSHCKLIEKLTPASVVDHIIPHRGDRVLFWNVANWQALCETCHNRKTASGE